MSNLRNLPISRRLWLILLTSILMLLILAGLMLKQNHDDLYAAKALKTRHVVETASGIIDCFRAGHRHRQRRRLQQQLAARRRQPQHHFPKECERHRASQPPSTARIWPCT